MLLENNPFPQDGRVRREAASLTRAGYVVTVVAPRGRGQPLREELEGVRVLRFPAVQRARGTAGYLAEYAVAMAGAFAGMLRALFTTGFDIVHAHNPPDTFVIVAAPFLALGKRFVFDHHDLAPEMYCARFGRPPGGAVHRALLLAERLSLRAADLVIATNASYARLERERGGIPEERIAVVRNGPDLRRVRPVAPDPELRARAGTVIGYVGVMGRQDGVDVLLRALAALRRELRREDFYAVLVGTGEALPGLLRLASELGLADRVLFTGYVSDEALMRVLSTADVCVDPDPSNPFNDRSSMIKLTEYMALGKPVVAFDLPEHRVTAEGAALFAARDDERDFARQLARLMDDPGLRERLGRAGRRRVETELGWERQERGLLRAYARLVAVPARSRVARGGGA